MNLTPQFLMGVVTKVLDNNEVEFKVPGVWENMTKYPMARPVNCHTFPTKVGDTIFVTRLYSDLMEFTYQPFDCKAFFGIKNEDSTIECKEKEINITTSENVLLKVNGKEILKVNTSSGITTVEVTPNAVGDPNAILNMPFTCMNCFVTGVLHGASKVKMV